MLKRPIINLNVNPGEPLDGTGKVCIHLFVQDERGPFTEPHVLHQDKETGRVVAKPTRGRLACDRRRGVAPVTQRGITSITMRTDDPRATTCLKCIASKDFAEMMVKIAQAEALR